MTILAADTLNEKVAAAIVKVWSNESVQELFDRRSELPVQIPGCAS